jgi:FkbM family methyltransferase
MAGARKPDFCGNRIVTWRLGRKKQKMTTQCNELESILERIESEPLEALRSREQHAFDKFAAENAGRLILFGAAHLGKQVFQALKKAGVQPIAFADNNKRLWDTEVEGVPVLSPSIASDRYRDSTCMVVTIYNGSTVRRQLKELGCKHVAPFTPLFWKYADVLTPMTGIDLPHKLPAHRDQIRSCYETLADEKSKRELAGQVEWRYWLDYDALPASLDPAQTYFPLDLLIPAENEVFVDCGSFQGDTLPAFVSFWHGKFQHIFAIEPDPENRVALLSRKDSLGLADRLTVIPCAVSDQSGTVSFSLTGTMASRITEGGTLSVECRKLDDVSWPLVPTYIKMDIEGAEPRAILGAANLIRQHLPVLAVCTYHRSEHLWQIPNLIRSIAPDYNLFLRRYAEECWEGVCYAIPDHRLKRA